ncbi:hypothetical protein VRU48_05675 [Pedobacter sp. KR3-3]|uniref:YxeA family protein n=1 Tax=Pedobacter albus TaxID=3113905 RepID=A0ABU7I5E5_9SPHI|nr:hypothetical protein [Pedobacter sp. KR3-3]MEE1944587.1 hypothetical protein [Pedobacter sp. KR3-3]
MRAIILIVAIAIIMLVIYKLSSFSLFEENNIRLKAVDVPGKKYKLNLYHIPSNATNQSYIQVRLQNEEKESVLKSYERYNYLVSCKVDNKYLRLILRDTTFNKKPADTILLKLP